MKTKYRFLVLSFLALACVFTGLPTAAVTTIAVLPFTSKKLHKGEDQGLRNFEQLYYSYRLIEALNHCQGIKAYFAPEQTPATDITIVGHINESNGRKTSVTLARYFPDGREIDDDDYGILVSSKDFTVSEDPAGKIWTDAAKSIVLKLQKVDRREIQVRRVYGYAAIKNGDPKVPAQPHNQEVASTASQVEIEDIFVPMTARLNEDGAKLTHWYVTWQKTATPLVEQRSRDKVNSFLGSFTMLVGAAASGYSAYHGYVNPGGAAAMATGAYIVDTSQFDMHQMNATLADMQDAMNSGDNHEITVTFYDQVYHLSGNSSSQLDQFRKIVQAKMGPVQSRMA